jgi:hypothetical protein
MMRLEKRVRALEARIIAEPVVLYFGDGSARTICGRGDFLLSLMRGACGAEVDPGQVAQLDLISQSVAAKEPGSGHMVELLRALMNGPRGERERL